MNHSFEPNKDTNFRGYCTAHVKEIRFPWIIEVYPYLFSPSFSYLSIHLSICYLSIIYLSLFSNYVAWHFHFLIMTVDEEKFVIQFHLLIFSFVVNAIWVQFKKFFLLQISWRYFFMFYSVRCIVWLSISRARIKEELIFLVWRTDQDSFPSLWGSTWTRAMSWPFFPSMALPFHFDHKPSWVCLKLSAIPLICLISLSNTILSSYNI